MADTLLLFTLLVAASAIGWLVARWQISRSMRAQDRLANDYFKGLNYLLNEEPDKAIEIFLQLAENRPPDSYRIGRQTNLEVIDTHLALGSLFRRRGEMDKAIRFHKHIIAQPHLTEHQRTSALRELARDYLQAGLLDRAERLFSELSQRDSGDHYSARQLLDIYEQEKDWGKAILQAEKLQGDEPQFSAALLAHFHCELAEQALGVGQIEEARRSIRQARRYRPQHPRACIVSGDIANAEGDLAQALTDYQQACEIEPDSFVLLGQKMLALVETLDELQSFSQWLDAFANKSQQTSAFILLSHILSKQSPEQAIHKLMEVLDQRPTIRGLEALVNLLHEHHMNLSEVHPDAIAALMKKLKGTQSRYRCKECGYSGSEHHWLCPSCRNWDTTQVIRGPWGD